MITFCKVNIHVEYPGVVITRGHMQGCIMHVTCDVLIMVHTTGAYYAYVCVVCFSHLKLERDPDVMAFKFLPARACT